MVLVVLWLRMLCRLLTECCDGATEGDAIMYEGAGRIVYCAHRPTLPSSTLGRQRGREDIDVGGCQ